MDSALFSEFRFGIEDADLNVEVEVTQEIRESAALAFISYCTLFSLPCYVTEDFTCKTTFKDSSGKPLGVIEKKGSWTLVIEILFLPAMPLETPVSVKRQMMVDLNRSTILDALERGYLGR